MYDAALFDVLIVVRFSLVIIVLMFDKGKEGKKWVYFFDLQ